MAFYCTCVRLFWFFNYILTLNCYGLLLRVIFQVVELFKFALFQDVNPCFFICFYNFFNFIKLLLMHLWLWNLFTVWNFNFVCSDGFITELNNVCHHWKWNRFNFIIPVVAASTAIFKSPSVMVERYILFAFAYTNFYYRKTRGNLANHPLG